MYKKITSFLLTITTVLSLLTACNLLQETTGNENQSNYTNGQEISQQNLNNDAVSEQQQELHLDQNGNYYSKDEVALYLHTYQNLPNNFITKEEAKSLGWDPKTGNLWEVTEQKSIGGDRFSNREGILPNKEGRKWYECDIDYEGGRRGAKRIVFSNDGLIYYTSDHYRTFTKLYGEEE